MKRMISIVFTLGAIALLYQFLTLFIMNKHDAVYSVKTDDNSYMINEDYNKTKDYNMYYFLIKDKKNNSFVYSINKSLNRQSRIIKEIKSYQNNNLYCIAPVLKNKIIDNVLCKLDGIQVSTSYLRQIGNQDIQVFNTSLKNNGYKLNEELDKETQIKQSYGNISIYDLVDPNLYITMWVYNGICILNNGEIKYRDLLRNDIYENNYAILVDKFYVSIKTDNSDYGSFFVVNIKDGGKALIDSDYSISKNSYFNGVYKTKIYFTDIDNNKQYIIDPKNEVVEEAITSKYFDGEELKNIDISDLTRERKYFSSKKIDQNIMNKYQDKKLIKSFKNHYYLDSDGGVYKIVGDYTDNKILLFKFEDFKEMKVINNRVFGISGDTLYSYSEEEGLRKIAYNRELVYNYKNIVDIYEK